MKYAFDTPQFGPYADPRLLAELAHEAEDSGWDGFFLWDHIHVGWPDPVADPWIALAAMATATNRILLGPIVTPLFRRHPWKLARETVTLEGHIIDSLILAKILDSSLTALAGIMGPSVIYGVAARACLPILERAGRVSDKAWIEKFLPFELRPYLAPHAQTLPTEL